MAERRMITKKVTDDENFFALSSSAQALYLHLSMSADDDGFCNQISVSMFKAHASVQDLQSLLEKRYIYQFENGVIVIKHWRMANALRKDRYTTTAFQEELARLKLKDNGAYTLIEEDDGCRMVAGCLPQVRLDKVSIGNTKENYQKKAEEVAAYWNEKAKTCSIRPMQKLTGKRITALKERLKDYSVEDMKKAIDRIVVSDFCNGKGERGWKADIDFLLRPDTITKILEGKYDNQTTTFASYEQRTESDSNSLKGFRINKTNVTAEEIRKRLDNH